MTLSRLEIWIKCISSKGLFVARLMVALEFEGPLRFEACLVVDMV